MKNLIAILFGGILLAAMFSRPAEAQILELRQTVFGMDCAPCAHGLEQRMSKLEGVESVSVSLNNSLLTATLDPGNRLTLVKVRKSIKDSGFQPKEAELTVAGTILKVDGIYILETEAGEKFVLTSGDHEIDLPDELPQKVVVSGKAKVGETPEVELAVQSIEVKTTG